MTGLVIGNIAYIINADHLLEWRTVSLNSIAGRVRNIQKL